MGFYIRLFFCFLFCPFFSFSVDAQSIKEDSLKLEASFLSAIGNKEKIDSLEKHELKIILEKKEHYVLEDTYWYNLSKVRFISGQVENALEAANNGIQLNEKRNNTYRLAKFYNLKASVYSFKKENEKAIKFFKTALSFVEKENDAHTAALIQNNIANIYISLLDYNSAYTYSAESYRQLMLENDTTYLPSVAGIFSITALKLNEIPKGKELAEQSLSLSKKYNNPLGLIVSHHCMAEVFNVEEDYDSALIYFKESLKLSETYRQAHFVMLNKLGLQSTNLKNNNFEASIEYGEEALKETLELENENTLYAIHKNLGYAYEGIGKNEKAFDHLSLAHNYYIKSAGVENQKAINDILIHYDTEKKEKELVLSQIANIESQNKLIKRTQWLILLGTSLVLVIISYFFYNRLQNQRLIQLKKDQETNRMKAAIAAEEKERERISNELHDNMASVITGIKLKLEDYSKAEENAFLTPVLQQLKKLHDETRRISHNLMPLDLTRENWSTRIQQYAQENSTPSFRIIFINNLKNIPALDPSISILLYRSLQELIHNAQKHAKCNACYLQLSQLDNELILSIEDNGVGFTNEIKINSQGLINIRKRLENIGAKLEIETEVGKGSLLSIHLTTQL